MVRTVHSLVPKFGRPTVLGGSLATRRYRLRTLFAILLLGFVSSSALWGADVQKAPATSVGPGAQFAIADFDGDVRPDLASIQAGPNSSGTTNYWIQLQLSSVGRQSIRLVAPAGGLRIEARDVNGDHAVDLILATAWFDQPVAVFLNNGHGSFSKAEPAAFPGAFSESKISWAKVSNQATRTVGVPPQSGIWSEPSSLAHGPSPGRQILPTISDFLVNPLLISHAGRAPPFEVLHL
jgi:hypothetical protein